MHGNKDVIILDDGIIIDFLQIDDAPGVAMLFREVYGDGYPVSTYYNPEALIAANDDHSVISTVARTSQGNIIGHMALIRAFAPNRKIYEHGASVVSPAHRNKNLMEIMFKHCFEIAAPRYHVEEVFGEVVCNHIFAQKATVKIGGKFTGLEVDLMPSSAYQKTDSANGRVSSLIGFKSFSCAPQSVYIPECYASQAKLIYNNLGVERQILTPNADLPQDNQSSVSLAIIESAQVAFINIDEIGADFVARIDEIEERAAAQNTVIYNLRMPLNSQSTGAAIDILRSRNYFFCGILPHWFETDGIALQKLIQPPNWEEIKLLDNWCGQILNMVKADWELTIK